MTLGHSHLRHHVFFETFEICGEWYKSFGEMCCAVEKCMWCTTVLWSHVVGRVVPTCWRDVLFRSEQTRWKKCWKRREVEGTLRTQVLEKTVVRMCGKSVVTRTRAVLKEAGEKAAKKQRKVESQEAKVARKKAKEQKAKKDAKAAKQRQRRKESKKRLDVKSRRGKFGGFETCFSQLARVPTARKPWRPPRNKRPRRRSSARRNVGGPGRHRNKCLGLIGCLRCRGGIRGWPLEGGQTS